MGWVNVAMITLLQGFLVFLIQKPLLGPVCRLLVLLFTWVSAVLKGLFILMFSNLSLPCRDLLFSLYVLQSPEVGGISGLKEVLPSETFEFLPAVGNDDSSRGGYQITLASFLAFFGMSRWSSWYPRAGPEAVATVLSECWQRKTSVLLLASALFQIGHYAVRPWPWILVALSAIALYSAKGNPVEELPNFIYEMLSGNQPFERMTTTQEAEYEQWLST